MRSRLDPGFQAKAEAPSFHHTAGICEVNEPVTCLYIDLDRLIERAGLSRQQHQIVEWLMQGYSPADIANRMMVKLPSVTVQIKRLVQKIVQQNQHDWEAVYRQNNS